MTIDQWFTIIQTDERFSSVCISKVNYWNIEKRVPKLNEWCRYTDIGNKFGNGILTINDYTEVEDSYVSCLKQIARKCGCSFLYVRDYSSTCEESENLKGVKVSINNIDSIFRESFRDNNNVIFYNMSNNLLIEFYTDLVCSVFSLLKENELNAIVREYGLFCIQSSEFHHIDTYLNKLLDADYKPEKRFVIVKYNPRYYDEEKYLRNEWTSFADVGLAFDDGILTMEDYIRVENNYISCIKEIVEGKFVDFYNDELEKGYFHDECDYACFLYQRGITDDNYMEDIYYYVKDGNLYVLKPFKVYSPFGEDKYYKDEDYYIQITDYK